jgi:DNA-binding transcriptional regulator WhiA
MSAVTVPAMLRGFARANDERSRSAGERDRNTARIILDDERLCDVPESWVVIAHARAEHPETDSWAEIGEALGWTKDRALACWRRLIVSLGYAEPKPAYHVKDRS